MRRNPKKIAEPMAHCTICGAPNAPHHHIADVDGAIARAKPEDWSETVMDDRVSVSVRLADDAIRHICDACLPAYDREHPEFAKERAARAAYERLTRQPPPGTPQE